MTYVEWVLLVAIVGGGCAGPTTVSVPEEKRQTDTIAACRLDLPATATTVPDCRTAAEVLDARGQAANALELYRRVCEMGDRESCEHVLDKRPDPKLAWRLCTEFGRAKHCALGVTSLSAGDPQRGQAVARHCRGDGGSCIEIFGIELAADPESWRRAVELCRAAPIDAVPASCPAIAEGWPSGIATTLEQMLQRAGCGPTLGNLCVAASLKLAGREPAQISERGDLLVKGCKLRNDEACTRARALAAYERLRAACRGGDNAACAQLGTEVARRMRDAMPR